MNGIPARLADLSTRRGLANDNTAGVCVPIKTGEKAIVIAFELIRTFDR